MEAKKIMILLLATLVGINTSYINAQVCGSSNFTINELINSAALIVEGKVIDQQCFWLNPNEIYTKNTIEVTQSSNKNTGEIYILTEGGTIDDINFKVYGVPGLRLQQQGIFFLNENIRSFSKKNENFYNLKSVATFNITTNLIEQSGSVEQVHNFNEMLLRKHNTSFNFNRKIKSQVKTKAVNITGLSPLIVAAGNNEVLTINGTGFGNLVKEAKVSMRSANSLNSSVFNDVDEANILSWSDTKIEFIVPGDDITSSTDGVASGKLRITSETGVETTSTQTVKVIYNKKVFSGAPISLRSKDNDGVIAIYVEQQLINDGALPAIENALQTWNCATGSNFVYAGIVNNVCTKYDGLNVICYDDAITNPTLGSTRVVSRNCNSAGLADQLDADIRINPNTNLSFTDEMPNSEFHFESVILHELGHVFMLGHVINEEDVMYPIIRNDLIKNKLTNNDIAGGLDVMSVSITENDCSSHGAITPFDISNQCTNCSNVPNISVKNITENSAYLNWQKTSDTISYQLLYRFGTSPWYNYENYKNEVIFFNLPACATVEYKLSALCEVDNNILNETTYTFTTLGCK